MDNLSPQGQLKPRGVSMLSNNRGFILNPFHICRDAAADAAAAAGAGGGGAGGDDAAAAAAKATADATAAAAAGASGGAQFDWHGKLSADIKGSPIVSKFENTPEGLTKAMESYGNLEKLLGHEKVPIPKDANDKDGWDRFNKAMGVPDKPEGYALPDLKLPDSMKGMSIDKGKFAEVVKANNLTPAQASGLWKTYNEIQVSAYNKHLETLQENLNKTVNALKEDWGGAYGANVELAQSVISQFAEDKETAEYLTSVLTGDPKGLKFLAKLGTQFAENKVGDFNIRRFAVTPEEAQNEIDKTTKDLTGPYWNQKNTFTKGEQDAAIARVESLRAILRKAKGQA